ncbi:Mg2+ and Co2+ transporter CorA [Friedmanniella luteola]|uniref:Mg2+ and Co2+ transporter CorA n=1 Tax=Friedmanniella luteola TaxID=546871 RepID=A0A1H2A985_9ACTN|nr:magnesium transporter CorA family protein [Friedmanniella luteola]SDT42545.1 Mg2+ and Co2+ transporter CorA [Friedmanniella luteola]
MELRWVSPDGARLCDPGELHELRQRDGGFVWLDIPVCDDDAERILLAELGFHPMAVAEARQRNHTPRVHVYPDHLFVALHAPEIGTGGHVHYLELDQFISEHLLVTVHGPLNPVVPLDRALAETRQVTARLEAGRLRPVSPFALAYAVVSAIARREEALVGDLARQVGLLEQRVMGAADEEPQAFLTALFTARHELLTIRTMASQSAEIYKRAIRLATFVPREGRALLKDLLDQYERVSRISQSQLDFLTGVTEFYRARTDTKMTIAAERLAVIAAVTLPVTALSSIVGMNVIVNDRTLWWPLVILLAAMVSLSLILLRWAKRQGWW